MVSRARVDGLRRRSSFGSRSTLIGYAPHVLSPLPTVYSLQQLSRAALLDSLPLLRRFTSTRQLAMPADAAAAAGPSSSSAPRPSGRDLDSLEKARSSRSLRIAIVTENFLPKVDGVTRTLAMLLEHLQAEGHEALVLGPSTPLVRPSLQALLKVVLQLTRSRRARRRRTPAPRSSRRKVRARPERRLLATSPADAAPSSALAGIPLLGVYRGLGLNFLRPRFIRKLREFDADLVMFVDPIWLCAQCVAPFLSIARRACALEADDRARQNDPGHPVLLPAHAAPLLVPHKPRHVRADPLSLPRARRTLSDEHLCAGTRPSLASRGSRPSCGACSGPCTVAAT